MRRIEKKSEVFHLCLFRARSNTVYGTTGALESAVVCSKAINNQSSKTGLGLVCFRSTGTSRPPSIEQAPRHEHFAS